jgi:ABC-type uncharacterized transport system permease subunit
MHEFWNQAILVSVLAASIRMLAPMLLAALGELVAEVSGVMNLGVEGMMLTGCFTGFLVMYLTGSPVLAVVAAVVAAALVSLLMAFTVVTLHIEQFVMGLAINLLASATTAYAFRALSSAVPAERAVIDPLTPIRLPVLGDIPFVGDVFFRQTALTYLAFVMIPVVALLLYRTRFGLELRSLGENPKLVDTAGRSVALRRYLAIVFGGCMAGLGGAALSVGSSMRFVEDMTAGRGWIAIVIVVAANWKVWRVPFVAALFAFLQALQLQLQALGVMFPYEVLLALPYVLAIVAMIVFRGSSRMPSVLGEPYRRQ